MIFLETDVLIELLNKKSSKGDEIFQKLEKSNESFAITSITFYEIVSFFMLRGRQVPPINFFKDLKRINIGINFYLIEGKVV